MTGNLHQEKEILCILLYLEIFCNLEAVPPKKVKTKTVSAKGLNSCSVGGFQVPVVKGRNILCCYTDASKRSFCNQSWFVNYFMEMQVLRKFTYKNLPFVFVGVCICVWMF